MRQWMMTIIGAALLSCSTGLAAGPMVDPATDDPDQPWCYLGKSTTVIGVPFVPAPVEVTYDGSIYTRNAELCFFYGEKNQPMLARQKTFLDGWIPVVQYAWKDGDIFYQIEMFSSIVAPLGSTNTVQFVRLTMANEGATTQTGTITSAIRGTGAIDRKGKCLWRMKPTSRLSFDPDGFRRDGGLVYLFSPGGRRMAAPGVAYEKPFTGATHALSDRKETGLVQYRRSLKPGERFHAVFKMPRNFLTDSKDITAVRDADYAACRERTVSYWKELIEGNTSFSIPEARVNDSYKAGLVHLILATRGQGGQGRRQGSGLPYDALFLNDYIDMLLAYDTAGLRSFAEPNVDWLLRKQHASGMFIDVHNRGNDDIVTSHGQGLFCLAYHYVMTRDAAYGKKVYPAVRKGVQLIINDHRTNKYGLIRPSIPYDAPMLTGHHTCHNLFALTALQASIRMARMMGKEADVAAWSEAHRTYKQAIIKAIDDVYKKEGYITSGLYDWKAGWVQGKKGRVNPHPNQDWENNLLLFPSELLTPDDPRVATTVATIRARRYREGCMTYRNGMHIHQYVTLNQANQYLAMNDQPHALSDLYHVLLHNGSTHEGFENLVEPWTRLVRPTCPPPHAWAAAKTALFIRNMMVREFGGQGGVQMEKRNLYLFSLISPAWVKPGNQLVIRNAATEMGTVSATMTFGRDGAEVTIAPNFHTPPAQIALTIPYFVDLHSVKADGKTLTPRAGIVYLAPDVKRVSFKWEEKKGIHDGTYQDLLKLYRGEYGYIQDRNRYRTEKPPEPFLTAEEASHPAAPLSFEVVLSAYQHEYARRFAEHTAAGGAVLTVQAPALQGGTSSPVVARSVKLVAQPRLIPQPVKLSVEEGAFRFTPATRVTATGAARAEALKLIEALAPAMGHRLKLVSPAPDGDSVVSLAIDVALKEKLGEEGYTLRVTPKRIDIRAAAPAGLFYGIQTLRQLLPAGVFSQKPAAEADWAVPCVQVTDHPRFGWRGLLVDPARHFIPKEDLLRFVDGMAAHKFNRLQIHLTDDSGWRIEIRKHPGLTEIGSKMDWTSLRDPKVSPKHAGFYTQDDMREIVRYAAERHITIIPEIEMPGHSGAAIVAYPHLGVDVDTLQKLPVEQRWRRKHVLAPRPETVAFMQDVLTEVMELFPSRHIHIGGDEAKISVWQKSDEMQALMRKLGCKDAHELHSGFIKQLDAFLTKHDRRMIGWDEILQGGLAEGATVMSWRGMKGGIAAAQAGHDVVMAPTSHTYFDYYQGPKQSEPRALGGLLPVEKVYRFEPVPAELTPEQARHILGGQGQLWGEYIPDERHREYMAYPRACALAETLWSSPADRDFDAFLPRLQAHLARLTAARVNYRRPDLELVIGGARHAEVLFDYFVNNWNVVGLKDYRNGSRITPSNELLLAGKTPVRIRLGPARTPLSRANPKLAMDGWMPIMLVTAMDGPVRYDVTYWATPLPDVKDWRKAFDWPTEGENFISWIRVTATNTSDKPADASVEVAPDRTIKLSAFRHPEPQAEPKAGKPHTRKRSWSWRLEPGASAEGVARYTFFPVTDPKAYDGQDADLWLQRTVDYWRSVMGGAASIDVPCRKATEALWAAHVCQLIANDHGEVHGGENFYDRFYPRDGAYQVMELEEAGLLDVSRKAMEFYLKCQNEEGRFCGGGNQTKQLDANGQTAWTLWQYHKITGDRAFLARAYPQMLRAARWTMQARRKASADSPFAGVLPAAVADGECLWKGEHHIVGYDLWNLRGMLCTADAARILGKSKDAEELLAEAKAYRSAIDAAWKRTGLKHFPPSWEKQGTHWGNTETLWPTELFERDDPRVEALGRHVREEFAGGFIEGTIQWKGGGNVDAIHPYMGVYTTMTDLVRGKHEKVVEDFYWYLLHSTAAHAFPEGIYYKTRTAWGGTIPHVTGACNYAILLRHMLVHEAGDELHLLSAVPDWWLGEGEEIRVERAPTHFGEMNLTVRGTAKGVAVEFAPPKRNPPKRIVLHLPASRPLVGKLDGVEVAPRSDQKKRWDFPTVISAYEKIRPKIVPPTPGKPNVVSLTTGKPATCSHALKPYPAHLANDGRSNDSSRYWATDVRMHPGKAWWQVDLEKPTTVGRVVVVGYYRDKRHYGFTVETSLDGKTWKMAADLRTNKKPSTAKGFTCRFKPLPVRYLRVTQTHSSANSGRHLVEVMAYEK